ncbi:MAG: hypothetical protein ABSF98_03880 [Bryobacteraceae bacterium]|jgi:uncharacterized membrane protein
MAFCASCGAEAPGNFCPKCGAPIAAAPGSGAGQANAPAPAAAGLQENVAGALCYLVGFITGILFLVLEPYNKNPRIRFHAFQAIFFHLGWIVLYIGVTIVAMFLPLVLHLIVSLLMLVVGLGGFVLWLLLMYKAYNNTPLVLPIVGPLAQQQAGK